MNKSFTWKNRTWNIFREINFGKCFTLLDSRNFWSKIVKIQYRNVQNLPLILVYQKLREIKITYTKELHWYDFTNFFSFFSASSQEIMIFYSYYIFAKLTVCEINFYLLIDHSVNWFHEIFFPTLYSAFTKSFSWKANSFFR